MSKHRILIAIGVIVATIIGVGIVTGQGSSACVTGGAVSANNAALAADCDTLLGMKSTLRGSGKLNWWTGRSIDKWDGIKLGSGRVVQVSLPSKSLDGIIPAGFGNLSALQVLDLSSNSLTGTIPSELGNLTNLTPVAAEREQSYGLRAGQPVAGGRQRPSRSWLVGLWGECAGTDANPNSHTNTCLIPANDTAYGCIGEIDHNREQARNA